MKKKMILLHGALGSSLQLIPMLDKLSKSFEVYSFNFSGHGGNPIDKEFSISLFVENTLNFMLKNGITKSFFFGYSMGGYVALKLANDHPHLVEGVFTYGTKFDWNPTSAEQEAKMLDPQKIEEKVPHFANSLRLLHHPEDWKKVMLNTSKMMLQLGQNPVLTDIEFKAIQIPVIIGIGNKDQMVSISESRNVANTIPMASLREFEGLVHAIDKVDVEEISKVVKNRFA